MSIADAQQSVFARPLPHSPDSERALLGALLVENSDASVVLDLLRSADFFLFSHKVIFSALREIREVTGTCDLLLLEEGLRREQKLEAVGGLAYLALLADMPKTFNIKIYAEIVREKAELRSLIQTTDRIAARALRRDDGKEG